MARVRIAERGHTLLELLIAASLVGVLGIVFGLAARFTSGETLRMRQRARASGELHAVVEYLRQDLARAAKVTTERGATLNVTPERPIAGLEDAKAWSASLRFEYSLDGDRLLRTVLPEREQAVVATGITAFEVTREPADDETYVVIAAGEGLLKRQVTLVWKP